MRKMLAAAATIALGATLLTAAPAAAAHVVTSITFPLGQVEFYSPFDGPATITVDVDPADSDATITAKLRPHGGSVIAKHDFFVDNGAASPEDFAFSWPALSVSDPTQYDVSVYRDGVKLLQESFFLHPTLVRITTIAPDPFFPWIDDSYKDTTTVSFILENVADAEARVYEAKTAGGCCVTPPVKTESLGTNLPSGSNAWVWDGRDDSNDNLPKGDYYVKVWADDGTFAPVLSKPVKVSIARTYRATDTKTKLGKNYHHVGDSSSIVLGGGCLTYLTGDAVTILCQGGRISVFWRWGLDADERIVSQRFELTSTKQDCPRSIRSTGHTKHESSFTENENIDDFRGLCTVAEAKITYSYPVAS